LTGLTRQSSGRSRREKVKKKYLRHFSKTERDREIPAVSILIDRYKTRFSSNETFIIPDEDILDQNMPELSKEKKTPERLQKEKGLTPQERSVLNESMIRHRRALEQLSKL